MPITMTFANETADEMIADLKRIFPSLLAGTPMQEQPVREPAAAPAKPVDGGVIPPKKTRGKKDEPKQVDLEEVIAEKSPLSDASNAETTQSVSTSSAPEASTASASGAASEFSIEDVRGRLRTLGATDGLGHDKVFEVLAHYKNKDDPKAVAKSASTMKPEDYAALIAEIDALLAEVK